MECSKWDGNGSLDSDIEENCLDSEEELICTLAVISTYFCDCNLKHTVG